MATQLCMLDKPGIHVLGQHQHNNVRLTVTQVDATVVCKNLDAYIKGASCTTIYKPYRKALTIVLFDVKETHLDIYG